MNISRNCIINYSVNIFDSNMLLNKNDFESGLHSDKQGFNVGGPSIASNNQQSNNKGNLFGPPNNYLGAPQMGQQPSQ